MNTEKLVNISGLSEATGLPVRTLRTLLQAHKLPAVRLGYRTVMFSPARVLAALNKFEVQAVDQSAKSG